jgi:hypothetical protein
VPNWAKALVRSLGAAPFLHDQQNFSAPVGGIIFQLVLKLVAVYGDNVSFGA